MATTKNRLNISLSRQVDSALSSISRRDKVPRATKAAELLSFALEIEEDLILEVLTRERDISGARFVSHKQAWK
jgi:hypothetical protein